MKDEYSELRAAFHAGARIQAWTLREFPKSSNDGYWRLLGDNQTHEEPKFSCEPHLYRVYPEDRHLIAELGQEAGAVADDKAVEVIVCELGDYGPVDREMVTILFDDMKIAECYRAEDAEYVAAALREYSSPAHTSEARDSERLDWLDAKCTNVADEHGIASQLYFGTYATGKLREAIDAAIAAEAK